MSESNFYVTQTGNGWTVFDKKAHRQIFKIYETEAEAVEEMKRRQASERDQSVPHK